MPILTCGRREPSRTLVERSVVRPAMRRSANPAAVKYILLAPGLLLL